jgi:hypothetical protein
LVCAAVSAALVFSNSVFRKERVEGELDEELRGFLEMAAEEKRKQGMSRKDALRAVRLERGSTEIAMEVVRSYPTRHECSLSRRFSSLGSALAAPLDTLLAKTFFAREVKHGVP